MCGDEVPPTNKEKEGVNFNSQPCTETRNKDEQETNIGNNQIYTDKHKQINRQTETVNFRSRVLKQGTKTERNRHWKRKIYRLETDKQTSKQTDRRKSTDRQTDKRRQYRRKNDKDT